MRPNETPIVALQSMSEDDVGAFIFRWFRRLPAC